MDSPRTLPRHFRSRVGLVATTVIVIAAATAIAGAVGACHGERDEARRVEAGGVAEAVRRVREAPVEGKRPLLAVLRGVSCTSEDICLVRNSCVEAYRVELGALDGLAAVRRAVEPGGATGSPGPDRNGATDLLNRSEGELRRAVVLTRACADGEAEVRRRYSL